MKRISAFPRYNTLAGGVDACRKIAGARRRGALLLEKGLNIYRIKFRQNGTYTYSNLAAVGYPAAPEVRVYPNPAKEFFTVSVREAYGGLLRFELYAASGARLMQTSWPASPGSSFDYQLLTADLAPGGVFLSLV